MPRPPAPPRTPWPDNFPPVITNVGQRQMREHPDYRLAKDGISDEAALRLVYDLIKDTCIADLRQIIDQASIRIVRVHAEEATGRNKIPIAYAELLGHVLDQITDPGIIQSSIADHGNAPTIYHRMVSQPWFDGDVERGADYLLVDDTCTAGGTLTNLKGFIESNGGRVVAMSVLARDPVDIPYYISLAPGTVDRLKYRHRGLDDFWIEEYGYGLDCLTEGEAGHLYAAPSTHEIRSRLAEARRELNLDDDEAFDQPTERPSARNNDDVEDS